MSTGHRPPDSCAAAFRPGRMLPLWAVLLLFLCARAVHAANCDGLDAACITDGGHDQRMEGGGQQKDSNPADDTRLQGGGISCSAGGPGGQAGGPVWPAGILLLTLVLLRRRSVRRHGPFRTGLLVAAAGLLATGQAAHAQVAVDVIHLRPTLTPGGILNVEGSAPQGHLEGAGGFLFSYANQPLVVVSKLTGLQGAGRAGVQGQLVGYAGISVGLFNYLSLGFDLPMVLWQDLGDLGVQRELRAGSGQGDPTQAAPGDLRFFGKVLLRDNGHGGLGVALMPLLTVPSGDANSYAGWGVFSGEIRLILDYRFDNGVLLAFNASFFSHEETVARNLRLSHELRYGGGVISPLTTGLSIFLEVFGRIGLLGETGDVQVSAENSPAEGLFGLRYRHASGFGLQVGAGMGLDRGYGAPTSRVFAGFAYTPQMGAMGAMGTASARKAPQAPAVAQVAPARPAPEKSAATPPSPLPPPETQTPVAQMAQVEQPPAPKEGPVRLQGWRFVFAEPITFTPGRAALTDHGEAVVRALAQLMAQHPEVHHVLVEGYVDDSLLNSVRAQVLSRERAEAVQRLLGQQGIGRDRIQSRGYGNTRPLDERSLPEAKEHNSRIEVLVLD